MQILFVCTGNTCRSPMAAFLARALASESGLPWKIESAGIYAVPGMPMTPLAADALTRRHIPLQHHTAKPVSETLINDSDLILTMTGSHATELTMRYPDAADKIYELQTYAFADDPSLGHYDIVDPFGGSDEHYEECAQTLEQAIRRVIDRLSKERSE